MEKERKGLGVGVMHAHGHIRSRMTHRRRPLLPRRQQQGAFAGADHLHHQRLDPGSARPFPFPCFRRGRGSARGGGGLVEAAEGLEDWLARRGGVLFFWFWFWFWGGIGWWVCWCGGVGGMFTCFLGILGIYAMYDYPPYHQISPNDKNDRRTDGRTCDQGPGTQKSWPRSILSMASSRAVAAS